MFYVQLAPLGDISGPLKSDLGVFWTKIPLYPYNVKRQKTHFLKTLSWADFDLLESNFIYIQIKKITIVNFFSLDACSRPMGERKLCIWFEKKYYFWNEVSLRLKAFKIKWSIEQHFRQFSASKYLLQIYNLPLLKMMKIELFICPLLKIRYIYASLHC